MPREDGSGVKSLLRALSLIDLLSSSPNGESLGELAHAAHLPPSTVHRLLQSLAQMGYIIQDPATNRYALGEKLILLGRRAEQQRDVRTIARPYLESLARATNETVSLTTVVDNSVVQLDHVDSPNMLKVTWDSGQRFPIHASASGKVFLAFLPEAERQRILKAIDLRPYTRRTIVDRKNTGFELRAISSRGYALDDAEREEGVRCVAAPIFDSTGLVVAAVSLSGPSLRLSLARLDELAAQVVQTAQAISTCLGSPVDGKRQ